MDSHCQGLASRNLTYPTKTVKGRSSTKKCGLREGICDSSPGRQHGIWKNNNLKQTPHLPISPSFEFHIGSNYVSVQGSVSLDREPSLFGVSVNLLFSLIPCGWFLGFLRTQRSNQSHFLGGLSVVLFRSGAYKQAYYIAVSKRNNILMYKYVSMSIIAHQSIKLLNTIM